MIITPSVCDAFAGFNDLDNAAQTGGLRAWFNG
jgi:hypothetical protein